LLDRFLIAGLAPLDYAHGSAVTIICLVQLPSLRVSKGNPSADAIVSRQGRTLYAFKPFTR
jgi:hypothetical protein